MIPLELQYDVPESHKIKLDKVLTFYEHSRAFRSAKLTVQAIGLNGELDDIK